jgi:glutamate/tyrosine decarboxylase-like PLP-dependent enzyme
LHRFGSPATTASAAGRFFGLIVGGALPASLGARVLAAAWDQVVFNKATSPIGVKLEQVAADWLLELFGLPRDASVGFVTGASMANFTCLAARQALYQRLDWDLEKKGLSGAPPLKFIVSAEIHVTVLKGLSLLGFGSDSLIHIKCDANGRMLIDEIPVLDQYSIVVTQAGNVNSGACDPIGSIAELTRTAGAWLHVDGAFGLWAATSPTTSHLLTGYENADSWVADCHKWLNTPYDCGIAICRDPLSVHKVMATQAPYLDVGGTAAPKDMVPEFSRSARAVEVWAALHSLGKGGVSDLIDRCCDHARYFATGLENMGFQVLNEVVLNQVVATWPECPELMPVIATQVQNSGIAWFGHTQWHGTLAIRISVSSLVTTRSDVDKTLQAIETELMKARESLTGEANE